MTKWADLKVYKNLEPTDIPRSFKEFSLIIYDTLKKHSFFLKESKTRKKFIRITDDFEQGIAFDNSNRWAKNQKDIHIEISIKPLHTETPDIDNILFRAHEVDNMFKMFYPLTKEFILLAEHLNDLIQVKLLPFLDKYKTIEDVLKGRTELLTWYMLPAPHNIIINNEAKKLIYDCAFRTREKALFLTYNNEYISLREKSLSLPNLTIEYKEIILKVIDDLKSMEQIISDEELYNDEFEKQNTRKKAYLEKLEKLRKKSDRS